MSPRQESLVILLNVLQKNRSLSLENASPWVKALCFGVLKKTSILDYVLSQFTRIPLKPKDIKLKVILYIGIYQLLFMDTPQHAAIFETVELSKKNHLQHQSGFVNAILQNIVRQGVPEIPTKATYNHPAWLLEQIKQAYPQAWQAIIAANNDHPPMFIRKKNIKDPIEIDPPCDVKDLPGFATGEVSVQDYAAQQAAYLLDLQEGQIVLDACAAPGGKTAHILETTKVKLIAVDHDAIRMERVKQNLNRLKLSAELRVADALTLDFPTAYFDRILLDAPCSGTGVIRRHPDIRFLRREEDIHSLVSIQQKLLTHLWPMLKPGGILLYATCSILPQENDAIIANFITHTPTAKIIPLSLNYGYITPYGWQFLPNPHGPDGFYYAKLVRI